MVLVANHSLRDKILFTLKLIAIQRIGVFIPIPGINYNLFAFNNYNINGYASVDKISNFIDVFTGGSLSSLGIFSLGIVPYINATIIIQILVKSIPKLDKIQKEDGEIGKKYIKQLTRYLSLFLSILQSIIFTLWLKPYFNEWNFLYVIHTVTILSTSSIFIMWLSEQMTSYGIGNGSSIIVFINIISGILNLFFKLPLVINELKNITNIIICFVLLFFIILGVMLLQEGMRKIPIISVKQLSQLENIDKIHYLPFKLNQSGVMPIIFASSFSGLPIYLMNLLSKSSLFASRYVFINSEIFNFITISFNFLLILFFGYFYISMILNPDELSNNLRKMSVMVPGVKPGSYTKIFLKETLFRLTIIGSTFLAFIAILPIVVQSLTGFLILKSFATTSILIVIGVAIDIIRQLKNYSIISLYEAMLS
uniref:Preprotein translocase subunit SecY n=1 Tax=Cyanidium sp. THAL103 TaxID=3027999 RepID=A0A9Y1I491_9RHOD|nr:preprotein translocase subunit SecY [Cyanidium sp. THAL103]